MAILKFLFGSATVFYNSIQKLTSTEDVNQIYDVVLASFRKVIKSYASNSGVEEKITATQLQYFLSLERRKFIDLFQVEFESNRTFHNLLKNEQIINKVGQQLAILIKDNEGFLDQQIAEEIIKNTLTDFRQQAIKDFSEKQGIYILLQSVLENEENLSKIKTYLERIEDILENQTEKINRHTSEKMDNLMHLFQKKEIDTKQEAITPIVKDLYNDTNKLLEDNLLRQGVQGYLRIIDIIDNAQIEGAEFRYSIFQKIIYCYKKLNRKEAAARIMIKGLELLPNDPDAIFQGFLGNEILKNHDEARSLFNTLKREYSNTKSFFLSQSFYARKNKDNSFSEKIKELPNEFLSDYRICYSSALFYLEIGDFENFRIFMEKLIELNDNDSSYYKTFLASSIAHRYIPIIQSTTKLSLTNKTKEDLDFAISLFLEAWEDFKNTDQREKYVIIPINISTIYFVYEKYEDAISWIDIALNIIPEDSIRVHKIIYFKGYDKIKEALNECKKINNFFSPKVQGIFSECIELLYNSNDQKDKLKAIELSELFIENNSNITQVNFIAFHLSSMYVFQGMIEKAEQLLLSRNESSPNQIVLLLGLCQFYSKTNKLEKEKKYLEKALEISKTVKNESELIEVGLELFRRKRYLDIPVILEKIVNFEVPIAIQNQLLLKSYMEEGDFYKALELCEKIRDINGLVEMYAKAESWILEQNREYEKALEITLNLLGEKENDIELLIQASRLLLTLDRKEEIKKLNLNIPIDSQSLQQFENLNKILVMIGNRELAWEKIYDLWRIDKSKEACEVIMHAQFLTSSTTEELKVETIINRSVVTMKNGWDEFEKFIIYDFENADYTEKDEINSANPLYADFLGKRRGDKVKFGVNQLTDEPEEKEITGIMTTHQFAFLEATEMISTKYRGQTESVGFKFKSSEEGVQQLLTMMEKKGSKGTERNKKSNEVLNTYISKFIPLGGVSNFFNISPIVVWYSFTEDEKVGINCTSDLRREEAQVNNFFNKKNTSWCLDIISLLTIFNSKITDLIFDKYGRFKIAQSTFDLIKELKINQSHPLGAFTSFIIYDDAGEKIRHRLAFETFQRLIGDLDNIILWIEEYCEVETCRAKLQVSSDEQEVMIRALGESTYDSLLLAKENNYKIIIDDFPSRVFCNSKGFQLDAIWSYVLIKFLHDASSSQLEKNRLSQGLKKLRELNYKGISPD